MNTQGIKSGLTENGSDWNKYYAQKGDLIAFAPTEEEAIAQLDRALLRMEGRIFCRSCGQGIENCICSSLADLD